MHHYFLGSSSSLNDVILGYKLPDGDFIKSDFLKLVQSIGESSTSDFYNSPVQETTQAIKERRFFGDGISSNNSSRILREVARARQGLGFGNHSLEL